MKDKLQGKTVRLPARMYLKLIQREDRHRRKITQLKKLLRIYVNDGEVTAAIAEQVRKALK